MGVVDPSTGQARFVGIFKSISWGLSYQVEPVYILGKSGPAELEYVSQDVVSITCTGWRSIDHGPHAELLVPQLQDLLTHNYITLTVVDRQTGKTVATFKNVKPTGYSTSMDARQLEEISVSFMGIAVDDETSENVEAPGASVLP
jgi:hypothetical protein